MKKVKIILLTLLLFTTLNTFSQGWYTEGNVENLVHYRQTPTLTDDAIFFISTINNSSVPLVVTKASLEGEIIEESEIPLTIDFSSYDVMKMANCGFLIVGEKYIINTSTSKPAYAVLDQAGNLLSNEIHENGR